MGGEIPYGRRAVTSLLCVVCMCVCIRVFFVILLRVLRGVSSQERGDMLCLALTTPDRLRNNNVRQ